MLDERDSDDKRERDAKRDRTVRVVLWASLAVALAPILVMLALVQPTVERLKQAGRNGLLHAELTAGGPGAGEPLSALLVRSASNLARIAHAGRVKPPEPAAPDLGVLAPPAATAELSLLARPRFAGDAGDGADASAPLIELAASGLSEPAAPTHWRRGDAPVSSRRLSPAGPFWTAREEGVYERAVGPTELTLSGAVALEDFASLRPISEIGVGRYLSDEPELHYGALNGSAARVFEQGRWRLRPELDLSASYLALDKVRLDAGEAGLFIPKADDWVFAARPSLALEGVFDPAPGLRVWPSLRAGATWLSQDEFAQGALMLDAPALIAGVGAPTPIDETFADLEAGLGVDAAERVRLSLRYGGLFGDAFESHTGRVELRMQF